MLIRNMSMRIALRPSYVGFLENQIETQFCFRSTQIIEHIELSINQVFPVS
jgi:hypothetical protein